MHFFTRLTRKYGMQQQAGFTLIELLIVIAIIGILSVIAYPSYQDHMRKTRRSDAKTALVDIANREEKFFSNGTPPTYTVTLIANPPAGLGWGSDLSLNGYYTLSIAAGATGAITSSFKATATAIATGAQAGDTKCATLSIDSTGAKTSTPAGGSCW